MLLMLLAAAFVGFTGLIGLAVVITIFVRQKRAQNATGANSNSVETGGRQNSSHSLRRIYTPRA